MQNHNDGHDFSCLGRLPRVPFLRTIRQPRQEHPVKGQNKPRRQQEGPPTKVRNRAEKIKKGAQRQEQHRE